jgi:hypothetical protein
MDEIKPFQERLAEDIEQRRARPQLPINSMTSSTSLNPRDATTETAYQRAAAAPGGGLSAAPLAPAAPIVPQTRVGLPWSPKAGENGGDR